jgi:predicted aconitase with swiveling domain
MNVFKGRSTAKLGVVEGESLVTTDLVAFWGGTNWETGEIVEVGHEARGKNVAGKILVFPKGKGGAGETFGYYYLYRSGKAPKAIVCNRGMGQTVAGALLSATPMVYGFEEDVVAAIKTGDIVRVDTDKGEVEIIKKSE